LLHVGRAAFHLAEGRIAAIASGVEVREGTAMARYFAFFVVGCAFTVGVAGMVETHHHVSNAAPQSAAYQSAY
jgi:hypothetical protein